MNQEDQAKLLNGLLTRCYDAEKGYKKAIENINSPQLKTIFQECANNRYEFGHQLKAEIKNLGAEVDKGDALAAQAHRAWIDLKTAFATNEDQAVLNEVIRGENFALEHYDEILNKLPVEAPAYNIIVNQRNQVRATKMKMEKLELIEDALN